MSDVNLWLSDGATTFNLWHGVGVKRIQRARVAGDGAAVYRAPERSLIARVFADDRHVPDYVLSTSPGMTAVLSQAFAAPRERCLELGYPRNDHLASGSAAPAALVDDSLVARLRAAAKVVGYFPTFRDDSVSIPGGAPVVEEMAAAVAKQGAVLLFKAHDASQVNVAASGDLVVLPPDADLNAYLGDCDVLVTDYSSVASDFLLVGGPIVLFVPDIDSYTDVRGFALDPAAYLPGVITRTSGELYDVLSRLDELAPPPNRAELLEFYWGSQREAAGDHIRSVLVSRSVTSPTR